MGADISTIDAILKEDYKGPILEMLNHKNVLSHRIEKTAEYTVGKEAYLPLHVSRNEGLGSRAETTANGSVTLPDAGNQGYDKAIYGMAYHYGRVQFTGPAIAASATDAGSFARLIDGEVDGLVRDALRDMNRQYFNGKNGELAVIVTDAAGTSVGYYPTGTVTVGNNQIEVTNSKFLRVGQSVDICDNVAVASWPNVARNGANTPLIVSAVTKSTNSEHALITFSNSATIISGNATIVATDVVVRYRNNGLEMFGLIDLVSDVNPVGFATGAPTKSKFVGSIDRSSASNAFWQSGMINNANAIFSDTLFQDAMDLSEKDGDGQISLFVTTFAIYNKYGNSLLPDRRFNTTGSPFSKLDGGFDALDYNGVPVVKDRDCQTGYIWGLAEDRFRLLEMADWDWMSQDGSVLSRIPNTDAYEATLFKYCELGVDDPKDSVQINGVAV